MQEEVKNDLEILRKAEEIKKNPEKMRRIRQYLEIERICARQVGPNSVWMPAGNLH